jgi:hypothetical protein
MAELKRNFSKARMNKDVDERLVPPGEYRDAMNIEISTSEGANVGTAQSIKGNTKITAIPQLSQSGNYGVPDTATCVSSIADDEKNCVYYFVCSYSEGKDYILRYNVALKTLNYLFVDIFRVDTSNGENVNAGSGNTLYIPIGLAGATVNDTGVRIGMSLTTSDGYEKKDEVKVTDISRETIDISGIATLTWKITLSKTLTAGNSSGTHIIGANAAVTFVEDRVLNFSKNTIITGVSVLDDSIYWTDGNYEPKKIHIQRSLEGTGGTHYLQGGGLTGIDNAVVSTPTSGTFDGGNGYFHTRLVIKNSSGKSIVVTKNSGKEATYVEEKHITVIKKAPVQPLELDMYRNAVPRIPTGSTVENASSGFVTDQSMYSSGGVLLTVGESISFTTTEYLDFRENDILLFSSDEFNVSAEDYSNWQVKVRITTGSSNNPNTNTTSFSGEIISISSEITSTQLDWDVKLDLGESLFEFKFPRFSYRYKYQDGEYSAFAPWSQIGFLPGDFNYVPSQGYNLGMVNQVRGMTLKGYAPSEIISSNDISEIDILYKEDGSPTVYVLKTLDSNLKHPEWFDYDFDATGRGEVRITSDSIYSVVPSNQLLRPWDNVPRNALAQEVSANRLIYGNYLQGYSVPQEPILKANLESESIKASGFEHAAPSVKSMREYTIGVTFSDNYGRETPVMSTSNRSVKIPKDKSSSRNRLNITLDGIESVPNWAKYFSYYVKETSLEYYNLVMDRWYDAGDGNIWLSFPSSERNKVDENTYIKLKKKHGSNVPVTETSRYKIISIENEVPDVLKESRLLLGTMYNSTGTYVGGENYGYPLQGFTEFWVADSALESAIDPEAFSSSIGRYVRFGGAGLLSSYYKVTAITSIQTWYKIDVDNPFGPDASFVSTDNTFAGAISDLFIEFFETETENKPEFAGRFFAKIIKDTPLQNNVLSVNQSGAILQVSDTWSLRYLNNNGYKKGLYTDIPTNAQTIVFAEDGYTDDRSQHPTELEHHTDASLENQAKYFWGGSATANAAGGEVPIGSGISTSQIYADPIEALNDRFQGNSSAIVNFWDDLAKKRSFFIDGATAYSLTGKSTNSSTGIDNFYEVEDGYPGYKFQSYQTTTSESPDNLEDIGAPAFAGSPNTANMVPKKGLPSRGIWHDGETASYMDISWTGMSGGFYEAYPDPAIAWNQAPFPHQLQFLPGTQGPYEAASDFIFQLTTPGTMFRFSRDPDAQVYTVMPDDVYSDSTHWESNSNRVTGAFGIRNMRTPNPIDTALGTPQDEFDAYKHYTGINLRQRWTIKVTPKIGSGASGYNPVKGTKPALSGGPANSEGGYRRALHHDATDKDEIHILTAATTGEGEFVQDSAIWETEPKDTAELDIYYQASGLNPVHLTEETNEEFIPIGSTVEIPLTDGNTSIRTIDGWASGQTLTLSSGLPLGFDLSDGSVLTFTIRDSYKITAALNVSTVLSIGDTSLTLHGDPDSDSYSTHGLPLQLHTLDWSNCWSYGNGVESDRIRDDFNASQLDNGVKASSTTNGKIKEERRKHGLIWSGIYNSTSGINETNQFIMAEKITKDLNPVYGSIQALVNRDVKTQGLALFCEDKVLRAVTNKDALYNADGNPQLVASNAVIGDVTPYQGDFGIGTNPESLVVTPYNVYFTDTAKGKVLALSTEGVRPISDIGMRDYFSDYMSDIPRKAIGTYDARKNEYNITFAKYHHSTSTGAYDTTTLSYSEISKGWTSFKSFIPEHGVSINNGYYTFYQGHIWEHYTNSSYNNFYNFTPTEKSYSSVTLVMNDTPGSVKSFGAINYEGSQGKVSAFSGVNSVPMLNGVYTTNDGITSTNNVYDGEYFNLAAKSGWYVDNITTDQQSTGNIEFKEKEGKYFGYPSGEDTSLSNLDEKELTVQGLGVASVVHSSPGDGGGITITINIQ